MRNLQVDKLSLNASIMKKLVFIVEDSQAQQKMLKVHFEEMLGNYTVRPFTNPEELYKHLDEKPFAVVLDHYFDNHSKTGLDYLALIRDQYPKLPVIYYTTLDDDAIRHQAKTLGIESYILKDSASLVRLRTALDIIHEKGEKKGFFKKLFSKD